ncbi:hypothetical protein ACIRQP_35120 [Streptomyces sp. NPDC102274]|uniref:hypothetical protein n=1 Tax=Streptomyces sp. NPDC102274 TaxID=3366151 RepID=UPI00381DEBD4
MSQDDLDLRLDGYKPVNDRVREQFWHAVWINEDMFTPLAVHDSADDRHGYYVLHDRTATWGHPGEPQIVALHVQRDPDTHTFSFDRATLPLPAMAQSWLIARGCPQDSIRLPGDRGTTPADETTRALEERLMTDGDHFASLTSYTDDTSETPQTTVLLRAIDERSPQPFRVLLEETDTAAWTHTLREGVFPTFEAATEWWDRRWSGENIPLPMAPSAHRTQPPAAPARPAPVQPQRGRRR